jgi:hypothetical protein
MARQNTNVAKALKGISSNESANPKTRKAIFLCFVNESQGESGIMRKEGYDEYRFVEMLYPTFYNPSTRIERIL